MKKATGLTAIILIGLVISSCDKKDAFLVNRRITPEQEEIKQAQRTKTETKQKETEIEKTEVKTEIKQKETETEKTEVKTETEKTEVKTETKQEETEIDKTETKQEEAETQTTKAKEEESTVVLSESKPTQTTSLTLKDNKGNGRYWETYETYNDFGKLPAETLKKHGAEVNPLEELVSSLQSQADPKSTSTSGIESEPNQNKNPTAEAPRESVVDNAIVGNDQSNSSVSTLVQPEASALPPPSSLPSSTLLTPPQPAQETVLEPESISEPQQSQSELTIAPEPALTPVLVSAPDPEPEEFEGLGELFNEDKTIGAEEIKRNREKNEAEKQTREKAEMWEEFLAKYPLSAAFFEGNSDLAQSEADRQYEIEQRLRQSADRITQRAEVRKRRRIDREENGGSMGEKEREKEERKDREEEENDREIEEINNRRRETERGRKEEREERRREIEEREREEERRYREEAERVEREAQERWKKALEDVDEEAVPPPSQPSIK